MIKNYFKIAWRNLLKSKGFSFINIFGLAIGLSCFILISLFVWDELNYDKYNAKADHIFRINSDIKVGGGELKLAVCSDPMGPTLKKDYPQVEEYTRVYASSGSKLIKKGNEYLTEQKVANVDSTFFNVFTLPAIEGDTRTALNEPNTVVITASTAKKYFGTTAALGKTIEADKNLYKVTAVIKDIPDNSHFNFDFLFSMKNVDYKFGNFLSHNFQTYIVLKKGVDYRSFDQNFDDVITKYILPQAKQMMQIKSMEEFRKSGNKLEYHLMPLLNIHLYSDRFPELSANGNIQYVYIFAAVAIFILIIACINFMNLSTARSANRAKEVGIRKVLGTDRRSLILQFLIESILTVVISLFLALLIASLIMPVFNSIAGKNLAAEDLLNPKSILFFASLSLLVGTLAGCYPAFFLSGLLPISVLKGGSHGGSRKSNIRNGLVVFQFGISIFLIISTIIVYNQLHYIQTAKLGFNKEQVLIVNGTYSLENNTESFKNEMLNVPGVISGTYSSFLPVSSSSRNDNTYSREAAMTSTNGIDMQTWTVDYDYLKTMGMEMKEGRNFSRDYGADSSAVIINETTAKFLDYKNPIGQKLYGFSDDNNHTISYTIIGIIKNFNFESLRQNIGPLCMKLGKSNGLASFKVSPSHISDIVSVAEKKWKAMVPGMPFSYRFLDASFNQMYKNESRIGTLALIFASLAVIIACLGLLGLATYIAEQRTKEIGIRKVLGANLFNLISMLSKDFLLLIMIAAVVAFPLAWWAMHTWLQDFAYRISIGWWVFFAAGTLAVIIALITISFQTIRAASANPVKSLRNE